MGLDREKRIAFYTTTYNSGDNEIDTSKTVTLGEMATLEDNELDRFIRQADNDMSGVLLTS